ncbi:hypoxanthine-guanine phosphoribosyltransferase [Solemya pervernicosa gill symbiont]|uniref:Hypoxanthine-guanine phosphoribosyltransferase n=2 Tax=Gammaproteobacteria incertae sedis TaxID=118884 RepID=A0A1T2LAB2_9GAMM|nr:hypoxanthine-guanine phosphoribosyltransferase [Candidatus Reidiella endopervernicosa]OOZ42047.1 hypoxanthine-guanine phosphoribosyltransferase [Solemya pervernicosa gill symbiont]QKQ27004.1 hypoxanthine-guanine phosphoribosyltransferase [Candidatus Reidiella endopervernicosa]
MSITAEQAQQTLDEAECLYTEAEVGAALDRMAAQISDDLADQNPLVLVVMNGAMIPASHLLSRLNFPLQHDYLHATRYCGETRGGELTWKAHPTISLKERVVLVFDDIYDEGITLAAIIKKCREEGASRVFSAVLVDKKHDRKTPIPIDYTGLEVGDRFVFGCGMDYKEYLRNVPGIYALKS